MSRWKFKTVNRNDGKVIPFTDINFLDDKVIRLALFELPVPARNKKGRRVTNNKAAIPGVIKIDRTKDINQRRLPLNSFVEFIYTPERSSR